MKTIFLLVWGFAMCAIAWYGIITHKHLALVPDNHNAKYGDYIQHVVGTKDGSVVFSNELTVIRGIDWTAAKKALDHPDPKWKNGITNDNGELKPITDESFSIGESGRSISKIVDRAIKTIDDLRTENFRLFIENESLKKQIGIHTNSP